VNEDSPDHPFEEFMISAGQYNALAAYATEMEYHRQSDSERTALSKRPEFDDEVMNYELFRQFSTFHCIPQASSTVVWQISSLEVLNQP